MANRLYLTAKHLHLDPFKVWHSFDESVRPLRPSRVLAFTFACAEFAQEEQTEAVRAQVKAAGASM